MFVPLFFVFNFLFCYCPGDGALERRLRELRLADGRPSTGTSSTTSQTSQGGASLAIIKTGADGYCCDSDALLSLADERPGRHLMSLRHWIIELLKDIQEAANRQIDGYVIGKSTVKEHARNKPFDPMNPQTWVVADGPGGCYQRRKYNTVCDVMSFYEWLADLCSVR